MWGEWQRDSANRECEERESGKERAQERVYVFHYVTGMEGMGGRLNLRFRFVVQYLSVRVVKS